MLVAALAGLQNRANDSHVVINEPFNRICHKQKKHFESGQHHHSVNALFFGRPAIEHNIFDGVFLNFLFKCGLMSRHVIKDVPPS